LQQIELGVHQDEEQLIGRRGQRRDLAPAPRPPLALLGGPHRRRMVRLPRRGEMTNKASNSAGRKLVNV
jgi:hypothetical protein